MRQQWEDSIPGALLSIPAAIASGIALWVIVDFTDAATSVKIGMAVGIPTIALGTLASFWVFLERRIAHNLAEPPLSISQSLPVGPHPERSIAVHEILSNDNLFLPQRWKMQSSEHNGYVAGDEDIAKTIVELIGRNEHVILKGEPGIGKSLTSHRVFQLLAVERLKDRHQTIPILLYLGGVAPAQILSRAATTSGIPPFILSRLIRSGRVRLLMDGFDELDEDQSVKKIRASLNETLLGCASMLTSRGAAVAPYERMPEFRNAYNVSLELLLVEGNETIDQFVTAYCNCFNLEGAAAIQKVIKSSNQLMELAARPLTLWMVTDVLASIVPKLSQLGTTESPGTWTMTQLYRAYTTKWLNWEAIRPGARVDSIEAKIILTRKAARAMFMGGIHWSPGQATAEVAASKSLLASQLMEIPGSALLATHLKEHGAKAMLDELCTRTFLVQAADDKKFKFVHKSFFEFFVAYDLWALLGEENDQLTAANYLSHPIEDPIIYFLREMLAESSNDSQEQTAICHSMQTLLKTYADQSTTAAETIRQHIGNLLPSVANSAAEHFLTRFLKKEPSKFVQRGIVIGLALQRNRIDLLDEYVRQLEWDVDARALQIGYSRIYHGDQEWSGEWKDDGTSEVQNVVAAQVDRLISKTNQHLSMRLWTLTALTLRTLLEDGRAWPYFIKNPEQRTRLMHFLDSQPRGPGTTFDSQRDKLTATMRLGGGLRLE